MIFPSFDTQFECGFINNSKFSNDFSFIQYTIWTWFLNNFEFWKFTAEYHCLRGNFAMYIWEI
jgi:hypothetical protein